MNMEKSSKPKKIMLCSEEVQQQRKVPILASITAASVSEKETKPDFKAFIGCFTSVGSWSSASRAKLVACINGDIFNDEAVRQALSTVTLAGGVDIDAVYMTLLAWYILEETYGDDEDQWQLIVEKAETWLKSVGIERPDNFVKNFSLALLD